MRRISDTIARLAAQRRPIPQVDKHAGDPPTEFTAFGPNPGELRAYYYIPKTLNPGAPLVVVLHGCTQSAASYNQGSGWSTMADRHGFALLFPEQQRANNFNLCFNWFLPEDIGRWGGEAQSISHMIDGMLTVHNLDRDKVFVTGLSAGGAMTSVMLATYPDMFAGGAIIAGLPFGTATTLPAALERMRGVACPSGPELGALVRAASSHQGPWPAVSVWHGTADQTVVASNLTAIVDQWRDIHGLNREAAPSRQIDGASRRVWHDSKGRACLEAYAIAGMGHGTPIAPRAADGCGSVGPFMLDEGISSSARILTFWGIAAEPETSEDVKHHLLVTTPILESALQPLGVLTGGADERINPGKVAANVADVINDALRAAGLLR